MPSTQDVSSAHIVSAANAAHSLKVMVALTAVILATVPQQSLKAPPGTARAQIFFAKLLLKLLVSVYYPVTAFHFSLRRIALAALARNFKRNLPHRIGR